MFDARSLYPSSSDARTRGGLLKTWAMTMFLFFCPSFLGGSLFFFAFFALLLGYQPSGCLSCCFSLTPTLCFPTLLSPFASSPHSPLLLLQLCSCLTVEAGSHSPPCLSFFSSCVFFSFFFSLPSLSGGTVFGARWSLPCSCSRWSLFCSQWRLRAFPSAAQACMELCGEVESLSALSQIRVLR